MGMILGTYKSNIDNQSKRTLSDQSPSSVVLPCREWPTRPERPYGVLAYQAESPGVVVPNVNPTACMTEAKESAR
jgi:hypothetical protein